MNNESAEVQIVVFKLGQEEYGVEIVQVKEIINLTEVTPLPQSNSSVEGVINLRGQIIPIVNIKRRLDLTIQEYSSEARVIVVEVDKQLLGVKVDEAVEVLRLDVNSIQALPEMVTEVKNQNFIMGVGKVDERLIVMLNLTRILGSEEIEEIKKDLGEIES